MRKILLAALVSLPSLALASGYSLPNTNPRDLSLSASAVAAQRDSGAAFALPAALARLDGLYVSIGAGVVTVGNTWTDPAPPPTGTPFSSNATEVDMDTVFTPFPNISVGYGGKMSLLGERRWGVGLGLQPFGGAVVQWPDDWPGRYRIVKVDRQVFSGILSAGVELLPQVRLGGGVMYYYTKQKFTQHQALPTPPVGQLVDTTATLDQSGGQISWDASIEVEPIKGLPLMLAFDYKHQAVQSLDGDVKWSNLPPAIVVPTPGGPLVIPPATASPILQDQGVKEDLTIPNLINIGVAYRVAKPLLLTGTFTYDRWEVYAADAFVGDVPGASLTVKRNYGNGQTYRIGAEYELNPALELRAGIQRDISGLDTDFYSPTLPDASSWAGSLGLTFRFNKAMAIDAAFFYANMDEVTATNAAAVEFPPSSQAMRGTYNASATVGSLAFSWRPGAK